MNNTVRNNIINNNLIQADDNIVIGVSGGPDSMALLYSLLELKKSLNFNIIVAHVNHGVRGEDALADQLFVEKKSKELNLPYYIKNVDMEGYAKEKGITSEEAGRELRYGFFRTILKEYGGGKIAVAHNKNDQAETLLLRIMRGTGLDGLKGMDFIAGDIVRPLLNISRDKIENYINVNNIETVLDKTNLLPIYSRNKVRLDLIPYIQNNFNPNIVDTLWRLSRTTYIDGNFLDKLTEEKYNIIVKFQNGNSVILNGTLFTKEDRSIQLRIIRKSILKLIKTLQGFSEQNITSVIDMFGASETGKMLNLPCGIICRVSYDDLIIQKDTLEEIKDFENTLSIGENIFSDYTINLRIASKDDNILIKHYNNVRCFDYDKVKGKLRIRNRMPGDKFIPFGMNGTKKVKNYFIDKKVPKELRDKTPLLVDDENIIWLIGYASSELYKITNETKKILIVDYNKILGE